MSELRTVEYTAKDFKSDQEVRWCPGCGNHAVLSAVQKALTELGIRKENGEFKFTKHPVSKSSTD